MLDTLNNINIPYCIATTSSKDRVQASIDCSGLRKYFNKESVHSGESDFNPPCFKPSPNVYLKAANSLNIPINLTIAVEDSTGGIASAVNAHIPLIIGYVGGSHIPLEYKEKKAIELLTVNKSYFNRTASFVISDLSDIPHIVNVILLKKDINILNIKIEELTSSCKKKFWTKL